MKGSRVKVFVRIKPTEEESLLSHTETTVTVRRARAEHTYTFDRVFGPGSPTRAIYKNIALGGQNTTILCYGNTSSGKSHTMTGAERGERGLVQMVARRVLKLGLARVCYFEIYKESVRCLLSGRDVLLRERSGEVELGNVEWVAVEDYAGLQDVLRRGTTSRKTGATCLNTHSSRSHTILQMRTRDAKVSLVDLAGSEDNRRTGNLGVRMVESTSINSSLFVLGKVVKAVVEKEQRVPYRDSKLTRVLQDSIGGDAVTHLICNVCSEEAFLAETTNTLNFASLSRKVVNTAPVRRPAILAEKNDAAKRQKRPGPQSTDLVLTPNTRSKSYRAFHARALGYEHAGQTRKALADYRTLEKISSSETVREKIRVLSRASPAAKVSAEKFLEILNSGDFVRTKSLRGVGDKRAQRIVEHVGRGCRFRETADLGKVFSERVVVQILGSVHEASPHIPAPAAQKYPAGPGTQ